MPIVPAGLVHQGEIKNRVAALRREYAGDPLIERIEHTIDFDWSGDPAVFVSVVLSPGRKDIETLRNLSSSLQTGLLRLVNTEDLGLHTYLNFVSQN